MSIAILSANTGSRHVSVMKTIEAEFEKQNFHDICAYPSFYEDIHYSNKLLSNFYNYMITLSQIELVAKYYELLAKERFDLDQDYYQESREKLLKLVSINGLQAIISTCPFINGNIIRILKETGLTEMIPFYIVVTDPFDPIVAGFKVAGAKRYFCATEVVKEILAMAGNEGIQVIGYPVPGKFNKKYSSTEKEHIYEIIGLYSDRPTILLNSGALGSTHYFELLKVLAEYDGYCQIIILCGINKTLYRMSCRLQEQNRQVVIKVLSYVDNINEILQISDIVITKAGANAFYECLYSETPMIIDGIHGFMYHEQGVVDYLRDYGVGVVLNDSCDLFDLLYYSFCNKENIKRNIRNLNLQNGTSKIVSTILDDIYHTK